METAGRLSPMAQRIAERLVTLARREQTVTYGEVAGWLRPPLDMGNLAHRAELSHLLGEIGEFEHGQGRPLLPAVLAPVSTSLPCALISILAERTNWRASRSSSANSSASMPTGGPTDVASVRRNVGALAQLLDSGAQAFLVANMATNVRPKGSCM